MKFFFYALVSLFFCPLLFAQSLCKDPFYPMYCRGKLGVSLVGISLNNPDASFFSINMKTHMPRGAGSSGQYLIKGTCAFEDRPVNAQEPGVIRIYSTNHVIYAGLAMIERCLSDESCVVKLCVSNYGKDFRTQELFSLNTFFPQFL